MSWTPSKWIAVILGFLFPPLGMLYVLRVKWAVGYFLAMLLAGLLEFFGDLILRLQGIEYFPATLSLMVIGAVHAYSAAKNQSPVVERPWYSRWYGLLTVLVLVLAFVFSMRAFFYEPFKLPSEAMQPTLKKGSVIIVKKYGYGNYGTLGVILFKSEPAAEVMRGEIIVFNFPKDPTISYVKRVVGVPGDRVEYKGKKLYVNGKELQTRLVSIDGEAETWEEISDAGTYSVLKFDKLPAKPFSATVPQDSYFVMGDNRDHSNDSRYWGVVPRENLVGKVIHVFQQSQY